MAKRTIVEHLDDFDGSVIEEGAGRTVLFAFDGVSYEIDLTDENREAFAADIQRWVDVARSTGGRPASSRGAKSTGGKNASARLQAIRTWAKENGHAVSDRGRIPGEIEAAYDAAVGAAGPAKAGKRGRGNKAS